MNDRLVDIEVEVINETDKAWRIHDGVKSVWLPKSQVEIEIEDGHHRIGTLTLPEWLAIDKGLV